MLSIPKITEDELKNIVGKKVIIYGIRTKQTDLYRMLRQLEIDVIGCVKKGRKWGIKDRLQIPVMDVETMKTMIEEDNDIIIQFSDVNGEYIEEARKEITNMGGKYSLLSRGEIMSSFYYLLLFKELDNPKILMYKMFRWKKSCKNIKSKEWNNFQKKMSETPIIVCLPPKTADFTIMHTFLTLEEQGEMERSQYFNVWHRPKLVDKTIIKKCSTLKVIVGVREPIAQNISIMYQELASVAAYDDWVFGELEILHGKEKKKRIEEYHDLFASDDVQKLWQSFINRYIYTKNDTILNSMQPRSIQQFIQEFREYVMDILQYPFDKEKGYTIIRDNNIEVFVYQLEKLNDIVPQLSEWVGVSFKELVNGNQTSGKWIGASYKQALQEIEITQEYFNHCFAEPYVKHCYSEEDIEKFKERWRPHIKQ